MFLKSSYLVFSSIDFPIDCNQTLSKKESVNNWLSNRLYLSQVRSFFKWYFVNRFANRFPQHWSATVTHSIDLPIDVLPSGLICEMFNRFTNRFPPKQRLLTCAVFIFNWANRLPNRLHIYKHLRFPYTLVMKSISQSIYIVRIQLLLISCVPSNWSKCVGLNWCSWNFAQLKY